MKKSTWELSLSNVSGILQKKYFRLIKFSKLGLICGGSFSDRFALKRHNNIHQKYGQTGPSNGSDHEEYEEEVLKEEEEEEDDSSIKDDMTLMA